MAKKISFINHTVEELTKFVEDKREELRNLQFASAGSKNHNVKLASTLRKDIARALTQQNKK